MNNFTDDQMVYTTPHGAQLHGDSLELLKGLPEDSVDLIVTSPPFALLRKKAYGNEDQEAYVDWLAQFGEAAKPVLKDTGSLVIDIGNAYQKGTPTRSLYPYRVLLKFVDELGYHLAEEFFWHNPAKLPSPLEWVNKRRIRVKDSVNTVWWFSKTEWPKADVNKVLQPYSENMKRLLKDPSKYYKSTLRPSEHDISEHFGSDNGGAIPSNLLAYPNTESNSTYVSLCRQLGIKSHPARFPTNLPKFFIEYLTDPGDVVVDIFSGSNTTGMVAEQLGRKWFAFELSRDYAALSIMRFLPGLASEDANSLYEKTKVGTVSLPEDAKVLIESEARAARSDPASMLSTAERAADLLADAQKLVASELSHAQDVLFEVEDKHRRSKDELAAATELTRDEKAALRERRESLKHQVKNHAYQVARLEEANAAAVRAVKVALTTVERRRKFPETALRGREAFAKFYGLATPPADSGPEPSCFVE